MVVTLLLLLLLLLLLWRKDGLITAPQATGQFQTRSLEETLYSAAVFPLHSSSYLNGIR